MMYRKLLNTLLISLLIGLSLSCSNSNVIDLYSADNTHTALEKAYFLGGIVTGVFAFGAFTVAVWANSNQRKTSNIQRFESTFFNMLTLQQQIVSDLSYSYIVKEKVDEQRFSPTYSNTEKEVVLDKQILGRDLFRYSFDELVVSYDLKEFSGMRGVLWNKGLAVYSNSTIPTYFDHYFRHLYRIIKFVDTTSFLDETEKYKYTSMLRATLSRYELVWLYYNCLSPIGNIKFKPLLEKYAILKNIRVELLTLSLESRKKLGCKYNTKQLKEAGFSSKDYEFFLTSEKNNQSAYFIEAFYSKADLKEGVRLVKSWSKFMNTPKEI